MNFLVVLLAATLASGNTEFDEATRQGACDIALKRLETDLVAKGPESDDLVQTMLADPARHAKTAEAEALCRAEFGTRLDIAFRTRAAAVRERLGLPTADCEMSAAAHDKAVANLFPARFAAARKTAVAEQAKMIAGAVKPDEAELETKDEATLRREMTEKVAKEQKSSVFEENIRFISETIVDPVLAEGRREMKRQREYLLRTKCESFAPTPLAAELEGNLRRNVSERQAKESDPTRRWGVFPGVVREAVPGIVERRIVSHVARGVDDVPMRVDAESVLKMIAHDPEAHRTPAESEKLFRTAYSTQLLAGALTKAEADAPEKERAEFAEYVRNHTTNSELVRAVETRLRRDVLPKWRTARAEAAKREADRLWPMFADRTWYPEAELADRIVARSDYAAAVKDWRRTPEMSEFARTNEGAPLLEETDANADRSVAAAFDLARSAVNGQNALVEEASSSVLAEARDRKASWFKRTPDFQAIVGLLTSAVEERWGARRFAILWGEGEPPSNAAAQHAALFPSVRRRIELVARQILEDMEKPEPQPEEKPQPEQKPEEPTEAESDTEEEPEQQFSIVVQKTGDEVSVKLLQGKAPLESRTTKAKMSDFTPAMKAIADRLGRDILHLQ